MLTLIELALVLISGLTMAHLTSKEKQKDLLPASYLYVSGLRSYSLLCLLQCISHQRYSISIQWLSAYLPLGKLKTIEIMRAINNGCKQITHWKMAGSGFPKR